MPREYVESAVISALAAALSTYSPGLGQASSTGTPSSPRHWRVARSTRRLSVQLVTVCAMDPTLVDAMRANGGFLHTTYLLRRMSPSRVRWLVHTRQLTRVRHGLYAVGTLPVSARLDALSIELGTRVAASMDTAAAMHGFDLDQTQQLHAVEPDDRRIESRPGVVVHQRRGAPLVEVGTRLVVEPAWTAVEVARQRAPGRALAVLDAAARVGCEPGSLERAVDAQRGRRGIVEVRRLAPLVDRRSGSPMESETRLVLHDGHLPAPELQWPVMHGLGIFYLDLAWPARRFAVEYDGDEFHGTPDSVRRDKARLALLADEGWRVLQITSDDVRREPDVLVGRVRRLLAA